MLFAIGLIIAGTTPSMVVFIAGRLVHGLACAAVSVPPYVTVARVWALGWRWVFLGVIGLMLPAAATILPPILRVRDRVRGDTSVEWSLALTGAGVSWAAASWLLADSATG
ncbi:hypothetical protein [Agromyces bauzanensis]|uniref:MFS transporter n=1 Tax=Agromyces bauzanensis TaxID=1308924 RepID=A0A917PQJ4_9MICO|nr:hypothetical protein [Agromyces bauzanensis]GGJ87563.1 hypothetical protein GCM10011372_27540 [Agromyces bauzanensis]